MRGLALYARSRQLPVSLAIAVGATLLLWLIGRASPDASTLPDAVFAMGIGLAVFGTGLVGADPDLERTAAVNWPLRRLGHVLAAAIVVIALVAAANLAPLGLVLRDTAGLAGLTALGATLLGRQLAWAPAIAWAGAAAVLGEPPRHPVIEFLTWPMQDTGDAIALITALVLAVAGTSGYALIGSRGRQLSR